LQKDSYIQFQSKPEKHFFFKNKAQEFLYKIFSVSLLPVIKISAVSKISTAQLTRFSYIC